MTAEGSDGTQAAAEDEVIEFSDLSRLPANPVVTVVMNTYEHAPYLARAVEGVLEQATPFPIELIISEDCSRDGTREIALRLQQENPAIIRVVTGRRNVGGPSNFRRAVGRARGRYIALCEGDDYWCDTSKLRRQVSILEGDPAIGAVHAEFSHLIHLNGKWRILERFHVHYRKAVASGSIFEQLILGNFIQTCTLCIRTVLVREYLQHPLSRRGNPVGDWPLCLFASAHAGIAYIDSPMAVYRRVPGSATNRGPLADIERARRCMAMVDDFCRYYERPQSLASASHARAHQHILYQSIVNGLADEFCSSLRWLEAHDPSEYSTLRWQLLEWLMALGMSRLILASLLKAVIILREFRYYR